MRKTVEKNCTNVSNVTNITNVTDVTDVTTDIIDVTNVIRTNSSLSRNSCEYLRSKVPGTKYGGCVLFRIQFSTQLHLNFSPVCSFQISTQSHKNFSPVCVVFSIQQSCIKQNSTEQSIKKSLTKTWKGKCWNAEIAFLCLPGSKQR